jgi:hypothetical protein
MNLLEGHVSSIDEGVSSAWGPRNLAINAETFSIASSWRCWVMRSPSTLT